uniref:Peptidase C1A papain C-terminal domain-containing protein n=1 Tax=Strombidium rassoulzadegani TaxID=1082188 RepID=A0A7S3FW81_9SPIT|mmetsp:Transcript_4199/g.7128  ORF Transcript_4199/g.7128 Transcript_4199/m.7128 type:complete len:244 (+) Transcript_4199:489-1220(+)
MNIGGQTNCSASYAFSTLSAIEDRICMQSNKTLKLSPQEIIDCDFNSFGCQGGYVNKVLAWGKKKGYITEECMEYTGKKQECEVDHFESNQCRIESFIYKINDFCIAVQPENIKREIIKNGPVIGQIIPHTDFLAYSEGTYMKSPDSFKFNGQHIVKILGWIQSIDGSSEWIVENTWGEDWGEKGYAKIQGGRGDTGVDMYALGMSTLPYTLHDYYSIQNMASATQDLQSDQIDDVETQEFAQ